MQKYLRHFPLLRHKRCLRGHVHAIPPTPLIKVASDAKPYYKLQPTTLNGGEGGVVYFINDMYYWRRIFVRRAAFQSKCLNNFATSCSVVLALSRAEAERLVCVDRKGFGSFYRLHDRVVLGFTRKYWFSIQGKLIFYSKGLSF